MLVLICGAANGACHLALHFGFAMLLVFGVSCGFLFDVLESNVEVEILKKQVERRRNVGHIILLCDIIVTSPFLSGEIVWYYSIALSYLTQSIVLEVSLVVLLFRRLCLTSHKVPFPKPPSTLKLVLP